MRKRAISLLYFLGITELGFGGLMMNLPSKENNMGFGATWQLPWCSPETQTALFHGLSQWKTGWLLMLGIGMFTVGIAVLMTLSRRRWPATNVSAAPAAGLES